MNSLPDLLRKIPAALQLAIGTPAAPMLRDLLALAEPCLAGAMPPDQEAAACFQAGGRLIGAGKLLDAIQAYTAALAACPGFAAAWSTLGLCIGQLGFPAEEATCHRLAVRLAPDLAEAQLALAVTLQRLGDPQGALAACQASLAQSPNTARAWSLLGTLLQAVQPADQAAAEAAYRQALALQPESPDTLCNLGCILQARGAVQDAMALYRQAIGLNPRLADAHRNLGTALHMLGDFTGAEAAYRAALALRPRDPEAQCYLGVALTDCGRLDEAGQAFSAALAMAPGSADTHFNRSLMLLKAGQLREGWAEHEWRWRGIMPDHGLQAPQWQGEALAGRRILLHAEQGLGDTLHFVRYAPMVAAAGGRVVLEVQQPLLRLLRDLPGIEQIIPAGAPRPAHDLHCPLMSLPHAFGTTLETIPAAPYLAADPGLAALWRERVGSGAGLGVGLVWAGSPRPGEVLSHFADRRRSITLRALAPLAGLAGVQWFSLQLGAARAQLAEAPFAITDLTDHITDFADTAALMMALDLIVAVDTSVAHLAGALGRPVWMLSRFDGCWRWLQNEDRSPWYPTLRLYRQVAAGDWAPPIQRLHADLAQWAGLAHHHRS